MFRECSDEMKSWNLSFRSPLVGTNQRRHVVKITLMSVFLGLVLPLGAPLFGAQSTLKVIVEWLEQEVTWYPAVPYSRVYFLKARIMATEDVYLHSLEVWPWGTVKYSSIFTRIVLAKEDRTMIGYDLDESGRFVRDSSNKVLPQETVALFTPLKLLARTPVTLLIGGEIGPIDEESGNLLTLKAFGLTVKKDDKWNSPPLNPSVVTGFPMAGRVFTLRATRTIGSITLENDPSFKSHEVTDTGKEVVLGRFKMKVGPENGFDVRNAYMRFNASVGFAHAKDVTDITLELETPFSLYRYSTRGSLNYDDWYQQKIAFNRGSWTDADCEGCPVYPSVDAGEWCTIELRGRLGKTFRNGSTISVEPDVVRWSGFDPSLLYVEEYEVIPTRTTEPPTVLTVNVPGMKMPEVRLILSKVLDSGGQSDLDYFRAYLKMESEPWRFAILEYSTNFVDWREFPSLYRLDSVATDAQGKGSIEILVYKVHAPQQIFFRTKNYYPGYIRRSNW
ncbi:MAG: hypothetical protein G01um101472_11 [Parcubacteria group bacterium Gr01-1014_72]|nr:MAG: hypothetical protein G01um101472_11 [Parcubacteria group bacterium Gr01-1014_72]